MGKQQLLVLDFALRHPNEWHSYDAKDKSVVNAIRKLAEVGIFTLSLDSNQFMLVTGAGRDARCWRRAIKL
jgi:hypothetical protein